MSLLSFFIIIFIKIIIYDMDMDMGITQVIPMSSQLCTHDTTPPHTHTHTEDHFFSYFGCFSTPSYCTHACTKIKYSKPLTCESSDLIILRAFILISRAWSHFFSSARLSAWWCIDWRYTWQNKIWLTKR